MCIYIPTKEEIQKYIWEDYVYEPMTKEDIEREQNVKVGGWFGERNGMYGKTISDEQKAAISKAVKKAKPWLKTPKWAYRKGGLASGLGERRRKKIIVDGKEYISIKEAHEDLGIPHSTVGYRCRSEAFPNYKYK